MAAAHQQHQHSMSTPSNSKAAAKPRPKRPLSGYNLFYRYKRNKILEATARPNQDNEAVIRAVLAAPTGLEGVSPTSPLLGLPPARLGQCRVAAIRYAMEGKLFPNENARNRLHRKVLGMGFVEMGRRMRQAWGHADKLTKDLFGELADVGRVRYRRLVAEYKLSSGHPTKVHAKSTPAEERVKSSVAAKAEKAQTSNKSGEAKAAAKSTATRADAAAAINPVKRKAMAALPAAPANTEAMAKRAKPSPIPQQAPSSSDHMLKALPVWTTKNPPPVTTAQSANPKPERIHRPGYGRQAAAAAVRSADPKPTKKEGSRPSYGRRVSTDLDFQGPVPCQARSSGCSRGDLFKHLSFNTMINHTTSADVPANTMEKPSYGRRVSTELDLCGDSLFEPLPVATSDASATHEISNRPKWGRRVSTDHCPLPPTHNSMGGAVTDNSTANSSSKSNLEGRRTNLELQQILLRNAIMNLQFQIAENNSLLPPGMIVHPQNKVSGEKAYLDIMASSRPSLPGSAVVGSDNPGVTEDPEEKGVSAQDFMDFIGKVDDAIDDHRMDVDAIEQTEDLADGLADSIHSIDIDLASSSIEAVASTDGDLDGVGDGRHTYIFGKPMFDMPIPDCGAKPASRSQLSIPMPAAVELKTNRARMA